MLDWSFKYFGAMPLMDLKTRRATLKRIRYSIGNQCEFLRVSVCADILGYGEPIVLQHLVPSEVDLSGTLGSQIVTSSNSQCGTSQTRGLKSWLSPQRGTS